MKELKQCPASKACGGCQNQGVPYEKQLEMKQKKVEKLLERFGHVNPIIGADNPYNYRNKVQVAFGKERGRVFCGNYVPSTHYIVEVKDCQIANNKANKIFNTIKKLAISFKLPIFDENLMKGCLRHVLVRASDTSNQIMVVLVSGTYAFPKKHDFVDALLDKHPEITTVVMSINSKRTSMVLGDKFEVLYGKGYIEDKLMDNTFRISASSFYQVNHEQTEKLYSKAIELAKLNKNETVLDAYCGTGTIGIILSKHVKEVIGVELNKSAVKDAIINAKANGIENIQFVADDAGKFMNKMASDRRKVDVVVMDPPRAGADEQFLSSLVKMGPKKIVYISCNPITQKDNLYYLTKNGYKVKQLQPVDMFPFTDHIEVITLLTKK